MIQQYMPNRCNLDTKDAITYLDTLDATLYMPHMRYHLSMRSLLHVDLNDNADIDHFTDDVIICRTILISIPICALYALNDNQDLDHDVLDVNDNNVER